MSNYQTQAQEAFLNVLEDGDIHHLLAILDSMDPDDLRHLSMAARELYIISRETWLNRVTQPKATQGEAA